MARTEARIFSRVWSDQDQADFRALSVGAQWLYWALLSQPELSMCGVLTVTLERWASLADDATAKKVKGWLTDLDGGRFVVHDTASAEVWIRTYVRQDGVLDTPNFFVAMARSFEAIHSDRIRVGIAQQINAEFPEGLEEGLAERFPKAFPQGLGKRLPQPFLEGIRAHASARTVAPVTTSPRHHVTESPVPNESSSEEPLGAETQDDDDGRLRRLAEGDLALREAEKGPVGDRDAWLAKAVKRRRDAGDFEPRSPRSANGTNGAPSPAAQPPDFEPDDSPSEFDAEHVRRARSAMGA